MLCSLFLTRRKLLVADLVLGRAFKEVSGGDFFVVCAHPMRVWKKRILRSMLSCVLNPAEDAIGLNP